METTVENGTLVIRIPLEPPRPSESGKTLIVASSYGSQMTPAKLDGRAIFVNLNAFVRPDRTAGKGAADGQA